MTRWRIFIENWYLKKKYLQKIETTMFQINSTTDQFKGIFGRVEKWKKGQKKTFSLKHRQKDENANKK